MARSRKPEQRAQPPGVVARTRRRLSGHPRRVALATLSFLLVMTVVATVFADRAGRHDARQRVAREAETAVTAIERRIVAYTEVLVGVRGLFELDGHPTHERFRRFVRGLQLEARYPGVETVSFAEVVEPFDLKHLQRRVERSAARAASPYPAFRVHPRGRQGEGRHVVVDYLEPVEGNEEAYGYDLASEPARLDAIARTQQTGQPAATAPVDLIQAPKESPGFLIVLATRDVSGKLSSRATGRFRGVVTAAFRTDALLGGLVTGLPRGSELEVYDLGRTADPLAAEPSVTNLMFDADHDADGLDEIDPTRAALRSIDVAGRRWGVYYISGGSAGLAAGTLPWVIAVGGALGSALAAWLVLTLARGRSLAVELAERMTRDLESSHSDLEATNSELRLAKERFRGLLEAAPDAMVIVDQAGTIVLVNEQTERMFGYARDELMGRTVEMLVPERVRDRHPGLRRGYAGDPHARSMGSGFDLRARRKDGSEVPVEISLSPLRTDEGTFISSAIRDVSERVRAQDALRLAEAEFRGAFDQAPIGMALIGLDGSLLRVNEALSAITGHERETLEALSLEQLTHADDVGSVDRGLRELVDGVIDVFAIEQRFMRAGGEPIWVSLHATLVRGADGTPRHLLGQVQDITDRRRFEDQLYHLANHDPLTGLLNRRSFEEALDRQVAEARRYGPGGALLVLDLDHFKAVNDTLGHSAGDELIMSVAGLLRRRLRESDLLARLGGDEFAILLPKVDLAEAESVAHTIVESIRTEAAAMSGAIARQVTASVGVAAFADVDTTAEEMLVHADLAMYEAKESGRDGVAVYTTERHAEQKVKGRMTWIKRMEHALADDRFVLFAQPIVDVTTREVAQHELLLRMLGDDNEPIAPAAFLSVAERFDMIRDIDRFVVGRAIDLLAKHEHAGHPVDLAVNVSGKSLAGPELLEFVRRRMAETGASGSGLTFEITETAAVANIQLARRFVEGLHDLGCKLALDDFGSGFGSFYYLKHLPFDSLKIDGEFVAHCLQNSTDRLVIDSVVRIAHGLGKQTVAEFTTDEATFEFLREKRVDFAQGYHLGKPEPVEQALALDGPLVA